MYDLALKYRYMITDKALYKAKVLAHWEKYGLASTLDAFAEKRRTLFLWKQQFTKGGRVISSLNEKKRAPKHKRIRKWHPNIIAEIKRIRFDHPNLGKDKLYPELKVFCKTNNLICPKAITIGRIMTDLGGLRMAPTKVTHFGKIKKINRKKVLRKPKDFKATYPGHCVALDTIEKNINGLRRYVITFEDIFTRFSFAWATKSHASAAASEFFDICLAIFPFPITFVLTDNGSEFKKEFTKKLNELHLAHYHTYPKCPKMNAHCERFNRTIQEEFIDYHVPDLTNPDTFNKKLVEWILWYDTDRVHYAFQNKQSPVQFILSLKQEQLPEKCNMGWAHTAL